MKNVFRLMAIVAVASLSLTSCNCFKKMAKNQDEVKVTCTPDVLTLNNGKVEADITVVFPAEYYNKKAVLKVTPIMVFEGGIVEGATKYIVYRSTSSSKNYKVIGETEALTYEDLTAAKSKTYYYKVVAVGDGFQSAQSGYAKVKSK